MRQVQIERAGRWTAAAGAVVLLVSFGARSKRAGVQLVAMLAAVAGLGFAVDQIADPPGAGFSLPSGFAHGLPASFAQHVLGSACGSCYGPESST
jgi:hypothetical protein